MFQENINLEILKHKFYIKNYKLNISYSLKNSVNAPNLMVACLKLLQDGMVIWKKNLEK
jgi:hypothetical protein